jgi:hypothetical protein
LSRVSCFIAVCFAASFAPACVTQECTEIACFDGVRFTMTPPIEAEQVTVDLTGDIALTCTQALSSMLGPCFDAGVTLVTDSEARLSGVEIGSHHPEAITIKVLVAGAVQREVAASPKYRAEQPNGPDCGGCRVADVNVVAPP